MSKSAEDRTSKNSARRKRTQSVSSIAPKFKLSSKEPSIVCQIVNGEYLLRLTNENDYSAKINVRHGQTNLGNAELEVGAVMELKIGKKFKESNLVVEYAPKDGHLECKYTRFLLK
uniref:Uncharacterized protein n=1 Tax=Panagrolaimus sp. ES5 TaxID=591445 RepID=A0AC34G1Y0_9BILA